MKDELTIQQELFAIQQNLKAPKNQYNKFAGFYYRNCEDIMEAVKPLLEPSGCTLVISDEVVQIGERYYVKATATLSNGKDSISNTAFARESEEKKGMDSSQVTGATSSYARKYALNGLFAIDDTKDADSMDNNKSEKRVVAPVRGIESADGVTDPVFGKCAECGAPDGKPHATDCPKRSFDEYGI